jgi:molybdate transport repressor ModE-like protein
MRDTIGPMEGLNGWESLEIRHLRAFATIARLGSFAAAAAELGYTQSAVSHQLRALEQIVGAALIVRQPGGRRPAELTDAGRALLVHAEEMLAKTDAARGEVARIASGENGLVAVATIQSIGERILPGAIARFRSRHPNARIEVSEKATTEQVLSAVEAGSADVGFCPRPVPEERFNVRDLLVDPYVLATTVGAAERDLRDVHQKRLLDIRGCQRDRSIEQRLRFENIVPATVDRFDDHRIIQELAARGEGIAIVPALTLDLNDPRIAVHPLAELAPRELIIVLHRDRDVRPAVDEFIDAAIQECELLQQGAPSIA